MYTDETDNVLVENCFFKNNESRVLAGRTNGSNSGAIQLMNNSKNRGFIVRNSNFQDNKAAVLGGAICADWADTEIVNCTFSGNKALQVASDGHSTNGGALVFYSMQNSFVDIANCTFANNSTGWTGWCNY